MRNRPTKKNSYRYAALCGLAMGTAIGTSLAITQRMTGHHRMPNLKTWRRALIAKHGEVQGAFLAARGFFSSQSVIMSAGRRTSRRSPMTHVQKKGG